MSLYIRNEAGEFIPIPSIKGSDGITPHIGDNGNWFIGDTDTGKPSRGEDGVKTVNGMTPDENGNVEITVGSEGTNVIIDATLTQSGQAADAKAVGDALAEKQPKGNYLTSYTETDPTVPAWAKASTKPTYTASEVGARPDTWMPTAEDVGALPADTVIPEVPTKVSAFTNDVGYLTEHQSLNDYAKTSDIPTKVSELTNDSGYITSAPVTSVNSKTGHVTLIASDVGADASGTASNLVSAHNSATDAHTDIRIEMQAMAKRLTDFFDSDEATLDQLSEIIEYITNNKTLIESITTNKVNVSDIVDNLVTNVVNKPLSAAQGVVLKNLIDSLTTSLSNYLLYYSSLFDAVTDINNGVTTNSITDLSAAKVMLTTSNTGRTAIILLDDISETSPIDVYEDIDLVLNGKTLTFTEPSARLRFLDGTNCTINGEVEGSKVIKSSTDSSTKYMIVSSGESLYVKGGTYVLSGNFDENILCMGASTVVKTFEVKGCTISSINTGNMDGASRTRAIQATAINTIIEDSTILADGMQIVQAILAGGHLDLTNSRVNAILRNEVSMLSATAVYNSVGGTCVVNNCKLHGDAPFDDADHPCADGMRNFGTAILNNTDVTGTISGFSNNSNAQVYVNGGIFTGYSHGGFYLCHGADGIAYINDALIRCGNYDGIFDYSGNVVSGSGYVVAPLASMYVGGGENENNSNITAYMDGCTFDGPGSHSLVLRGSSGETGITVNISNSAIANGKLIRVDNSTHKLRVGFGNGFTSENIDHPLYSEFNNYLYRKLYHASKCNGKDYETLYQHYIQLCEQSTNNTELILISSTEGSTKKFKLTIGDDGVLTATEIVE